MPAGALGAPIDAEVVTLLDENAARKLDTRIRLTAGTVRDNFAKLQDYVHEAKTGEIHRALGFKSWTAYLSDALGAQPLMVDREQRHELVEYLSNEGMSTRAIASVTGMNRETVRQGVKAGLGGKKLSPRSSTTGLDGKQYMRKHHQPTPPKSATNSHPDSPTDRSEPTCPAGPTTALDSRYKLRQELLASLIDTIQATVDVFRDLDECPADVAARYRNLARTAVEMCRCLEQKFAPPEELRDAQ